MGCKINTFLLVLLLLAIPMGAQDDDAISLWYLKKSTPTLKSKQVRVIAIEEEGKTGSVRLRNLEYTLLSNPFFTTMISFNTYYFNEQLKPLNEVSANVSFAPYGDYNILLQTSYFYNDPALFWSTNYIGTKVALEKSIFNNLLLSISYKNLFFSPDFYQTYQKHFNDSTIGLNLHYQF